MPFPIALVALAISAGAKIWSGAKQRKQARELANKNVRPEYNDELYDELVGLMRADTQYGINPSSLNMLQQNNNATTTAALNTALQAGGNPNTVANIYQQGINANNQLGIADSEMRYRKVGALSNAIDRLYGNRRDEFLYNADAPFKDAAQLAAAKNTAGYNSMMSGFQDILAGAINQFAGSGYGQESGFGFGFGGNDNSTRMGSTTNDPYLRAAQPVGRSVVNFAGGINTSRALPAGTSGYLDDYWYL